MVANFLPILTILRLAASSRKDLLLETAALRQQLAVLTREGKKPRIRRSDRAFWDSLFKNWPKWKGALVDDSTRRPEYSIRQFRPSSCT